MADNTGKNRKRAVVGIIAHVDAGKTTLTEGILYATKTIRSMGRVDHKDTFLDNFPLERERGITIFSKQALFSAGNIDFTLIDTPGHADFAPETERCLKALDGCILVISGTEGIQAHTRTLWKLIDRYKLPCFVFVNKTDRMTLSKQELMLQLKDGITRGCTDFSVYDAAFFESVAENDEHLTEKYLEGKKITDEEIAGLVGQRKVTPVFFGSALKNTGVEELLEGLGRFFPVPERKRGFGAYIYKIRYDEKGERLSFAKITGGSLKVRDTVAHNDPETEPEKVSLIRVYNGVKFETVQEAEAGAVVALTGLKNTFAGEVLGCEEEGPGPLLVPVLLRKLVLPEGTDIVTVLPALKMLEEENPEISLVWNEKLKEISFGTMGDIQDEILKSLIEEKLGVPVSFDEGSVLYKETILSQVEGIGHFEPLRHYAEVHLLMMPAPRGSGIIAESELSEDLLDRNWQRLILTHILERTHRGVLTGAPLTDVKISLVGGRAHKKHTVGGDFRQAVYRAVRQGLMQAESTLLEPFYDFRIEIPQEFTGRAMTDIERMAGKCGEPMIENGRACLTGSGPVSTFRSYASEVTAYSRGLGTVSFSFGGYDICHNGAEIKAMSGYNPDADIHNPSSSVFCAGGAGFTVEWDRVRDYMHEAGLDFESEDELPAKALSRRVSDEAALGTDEIDEILARASSSNRKRESDSRRKRAREMLEKRKASQTAAKPAKKQYMLIDGYNVLFSDEELTELAKADLSAARNKLLERVSNYAGTAGFPVAVVFDAYRVENHPAETIKMNNMDVVFTKTAETADRYIERFAHLKASEFDICVVTSDLTEQVIIMGAGCRRMFSEEFFEEMQMKEQLLREKYGVK